MLKHLHINHIKVPPNIESLVYNYSLRFYAIEIEGVYFKMLVKLRVQDNLLSGIYQSLNSIKA